MVVLFGVFAYILIYGEFMKIVQKVSIKKFDYLLFILVILLVAFGCLMVYSASFYQAGKQLGDSEFYLKKQIMGGILGLIGMLIFSLIDYHFLLKLKWPAFIIGLILLCLVFIPGVSKTAYGAKRWINLGAFTIQASEVAKFTFVLFAACSLFQNRQRVKTWRGVLPTVFAGTITCVLIILEPNMSITVCVGLIMLIMLFIGGARFKHFALLSIPVIIAIPVLIILEPYRLNRLSAFLDPWATPLGEGYQLIQSLYALGNGGFFGVGLFNSIQKYMFLPFAESDFILAIIGEEFGFFGVITLAIIYLLIICRCVSIGMHADSRFGTYLCIGIASVIAVQFLVNMCVVSGAIPPTGLPLPFISAGSTSLLVFMSAIGVVLNVDRQSRKNLVIKY